MSKTLPLSPEKLRTSLDPARVPFADSNAIPRNGQRQSPQTRVLKALELGLNITARGFNIYLAGEAELGRSYLLRDYLTPRARKGVTPPDLVYVHNFEDPDAPILLPLPAGQGVRLKAALGKVFVRIQKEIAVRLERGAYTRRRTLLMDKFQSQRERLLDKMNKMALAQGFNLGMDEGGGMTLYPMVEGRRLNEQEYESLEETRRKELKVKGDSLMEPMSGFLRKLARAERNLTDAERDLEREMVDEVLKSTLDPLAEKFLPQCDCEGLRIFMAALRADTLENLDAVMPPDPQPAPPDRRPSGPGHPEGVPYPPLYPEDMRGRYDVNVFVDNGAALGAPIVFEDHPTLSNLMGCIEREAEMGALVTDFTLIKAGAVHRANGGYLILHMDDLLRYSSAWEALLRALRSGVSRIEDAGEEDGNKAKGLRPAPVPLSLKVILIGSEDLYEILLDADDRFNKLFKIKAHFTEYMPRNQAGIRTYLHHIRRIIDDDGLLPFDREALAALVDHGSRLIEDQQRLSLRFPRLREIMVEASALATMAGKDMVDGAMLRRAQDARNFRSNLVEELYMEEYDRRIIKVVTKGEAVGRANGLAVSSFGDFEFGLPHQISCTVGAGSGGIIDLERDAQLGGPIHTKAMMILKSYLVGSFAHNKPLVLTGSLGFEQNYVGIEGDSASGAELAALLSALAGVPIRLSFAFTGAVGQSGEIMAVGGVTRKIEGYFEVCRRHGLTGKQGVIMPRDNIDHALLHGSVVEAVAAGQFHIYAVEHITEAMELLTGLPPGRLRKDGTYTPGSLYDRVDRRLAELTRISTRSNRRR